MTRILAARILAVRSLAAAILALALAGCTPEPEPDPHTQAIHEGDPCGSPNATCIDEIDLLVCVEGFWASQSCEDSCAAIGPGVSSLGCNLDKGFAPAESLCECMPPADGCNPGQARCDDVDVLGWCTETWTWASSSCAELCAAQSLLSLGCTSIGDKATCFCTNIGTPCAGDTIVCANDSALLSCTDGVWTEVDCSDVCGGPATCDPGAIGGAACACDG